MSTSQTGVLHGDWLSWRDKTRLFQLDCRASRLIAQPRPIYRRAGRLPSCLHWDVVWWHGSGLGPAQYTLSWDNIRTADVELLYISLSHFFLPHEFQQLFYTQVWVYLWANKSTVSQLISDVTHKLDPLCPEASQFFLVDFNLCKQQMSTSSWSCIWW